MTRLDRAVRRLVKLDRHEYVVALEPGAEPLITFRERGKRHTYTCSLERVLYRVARAEAQAAVESRRERRRIK